MLKKHIGHLLLFFSLLNFYSCAAPTQEEVCPLIQEATKDNTQCCKALSPCCAAFSGDKKTDCLAHTVSNANLSCQALYQEGRDSGLCQPVYSGTNSP